MRPSPGDISVVICSYSLPRWGDLHAAVDSVFAQSQPPAEIILVTDHNTELFERARAAFPAALVIESSQSAGLSGARNTGVRAARGGVVAFLDDDAIADPDWLERLAEAYADDGVLGVGGRIEPMWDTSRPRWMPREFDWVVGCTYEGAANARSPIRNMIGANMSLRRDPILEVGGFRCEFGHTHAAPMGGEETELCIRIARRYPYRVFLHTPRARVRHRVPAGRATWSYFSLRCFSEGRTKARIAATLGAEGGLSSERRHAVVTLPKGALRDLRSAVSKRDPWGVARAATIVAGLAVTTCGYIVGRAAMLGRSPKRP